MIDENSFHYTYSAPENQEVLNIRKKYLPQPESKLEELKRLDGLVQTAGTMEALCAGIGGALFLGLGMCLAMGVIGHSQRLGILLGLAGMLGMLAAYPVQRRSFQKAKARYAPRILALADELSGTNQQIIFERGNQNEQ